MSGLLEIVEYGSIRWDHRGWGGAVNRNKLTLQRTELAVECDDVTGMTMTRIVD